MYYLHNVHAATASAQSVYLRRFLPFGPCLCVVQHTSLSFVALRSHTSAVAPLSELFSVPLNGRIIRIAVVPSHDMHHLEKLLVLTDHHLPRLISLSYDQQTGLPSELSIHTESALQLEELGRPPAESGQTLEVEEGQNSSYAYSHTHVGILKIIDVSPNSTNHDSINLAHAFDVRYVIAHLLGLI